MSRFSLQNLTFFIALTLMIGWLLVIGRSLFLPIIVAVIVVYILSTASNAMRRLPGFRALPAILINLALLLAFTAAFLALVLVIAMTVDELVAVAPKYQANLEQLTVRLAAMAHVSELPSWQEIRSAVLEYVNLQALLLRFIGGLTNTGSTIFLVIIYAAFLFSERIGFSTKLAVAFPHGNQAEKLQAVMAEINRKIGDYLAVKTLINVILAAFSYVIMWFMGVDFALFWAVAIGLMNYIPYFGSLVGVMLPVVLSLAQFASLSTTLLLALLLTTAQVIVGNFIEPRTLGRELNLSPFVILVALSVWSALWGLPGAILAVPMTSMIAITLSSIGPTRFVAVLLSERPATARRNGQDSASAVRPVRRSR